MHLLFFEACHTFTSHTRNAYGNMYLDEVHFLEKVDYFFDTGSSVWQNEPGFEIFQLAASVFRTSFMGLTCRSGLLWGSKDLKDQCTLLCRRENGDSSIAR